MKQREPDGLLDLKVTVDLDVGGVPVVVEERTLLRQQSVPARLHGADERGGSLVAHRFDGSRR